ncbi:MAG TPA: Sec-independent protein translocase protein TatB [Sphingomonadales bacterium]|nr:Sec-independent protein translocase protein TatB [Sphingomonadales bacterium]
MFDIAGTELLLIIALAVIFIGPKELPRVMRAVGAFARKARSVVADFQQSFEDIANRSDLEKLQREVRDTVQAAEQAAAQNLDPMAEETDEAPPAPQKKDPE